jgi:triosephosphate isomerase (TIM)
MRKKILAANWKMNLTHVEAESYVEAFLNEVGEVNDVEIVIIPAFTSIPIMAQASGNAPFIRLGAQNLHWEKNGAFTGEISATMLRALFVKYVIIGHSERRALFGETDEMVQKKVHTALEAGLRPIMCVGETLTEREAGSFQKVLHRQVEEGLKGVPAEHLSEVVLAYEPVWAIGTGRTATPAQAEEVHAFLRSLLAELFDQAAADRTRIQYGGSVKPENTEELMREPNIDGALVGGASLDAHIFAQGISATEKALKL